MNNEQQRSDLDARFHRWLAEMLRRVRSLVFSFSELLAERGTVLALERAGEQRFFWGDSIRLRSTRLEA